MQKGQIGQLKEELQYRNMQKLQWQRILYSRPPLAPQRNNNPVLLAVDVADTALSRTSVSRAPMNEPIAAIRSRQTTKRVIYAPFTFHSVQTAAPRGNASSHVPSQSINSGDSSQIKPKQMVCFFFR